MVILDEIASEHLGLFMSQTINKHLSRAVGSIAALGLAGIVNKLLDILLMRLLVCSRLLLQLLQHLLGGLWLLLFVTHSNSFLQIKRAASSKR